MVNQAVGDALSGILMIETILRYCNWSLEKWNSMYKDLPSRQLKVKLDLCNLDSLSLSLGLTFHLTSLKVRSLQGCHFWNGFLKNLFYYSKKKKVSEFLNRTELPQSWFFFGGERVMWFVTQNGPYC